MTKREASGHLNWCGEARDREERAHTHTYTNTQHGPPLKRLRKHAPGRIGTNPRKTINQEMSHDRVLSGSHWRGRGIKCFRCLG